MKLVMVEPEKLAEMEENPNELKGERYEQLKREIERVGFISPIICRKEKNKLAIIGGAHRKKIAIELNLAKVPVVIVDVSKKEALNQLINLNAIHGEPDRQKLESLYQKILAENEMSVEELQSIFLPEESILKKLQQIEEEEKKNLKSVEFMAKNDSPIVLNLSYLGEEKKIVKEALILTGVKDERLGVLELAKSYLENYGGKRR